MKNSRTISAPLFILVSLLISSGLFFRFYNIDKKYYWQDEAWTSLYISGHMLNEYRGEIFNGEEMGVKELERFQKVSSDRNLINLGFASLADTKHPPLYFFSLWLWAKIFGSSVTSLRLFSAIISILALPSIFLLCMELFQRRDIAWIATVSAAISPLHILYAQETRSYALLTVWILLSSALFLRALRLNGRKDWILYTLSISAGIYTHTIFLTTIFSQLLYIAILKFNEVRSFNLSPKFKSYFKSILSVVAIFSPWLSVMILAFPVLKNSARWVTGEIGLNRLLEGFIFAVSSLYVDTFCFTYHKETFSAGSIASIAIHLLIAGSTLYSILYLCSRASKEIWLFVVLLIGGVLLFTLVPDLIFGGKRSTVARFMFPLFIGIELSISFLIAESLSSKKRLQRTLFKILTAILIVGGLISISVSSQANRWWNKGGASEELLLAAGLINNSSHPLLISDPTGVNVGNTLALSHLLEENVWIKFEPDPDEIRCMTPIPEWARRLAGIAPPKQVKPFEITGNYSDIYLLDPSPQLLKKILEEKSLSLEEICIPSRLWRLKQL
jgi:uncharacterized membrane protein